MICKECINFYSCINKTDTAVCGRFKSNGTSDFRCYATCEGCVHKQPCYDFEPLCETCARHWPDLYEREG